MLFKSITASFLLLALTSSVNAQDSTSQSQGGCVIAPALGAASPGQGDVQHPSTSAPCGDKSISQNLDSSTPVPADSNGQFNVQITSFGSGTNNSRLLQSAKVDPTAAGTSFSDCQIVSNGAQDPSGQGSQQLAIKLPENTKCSGGTSGKLCLVSFVTDAGDGNCVVVSQADTTGQSSTTSADAGKAKTGSTTPQDGQKVQNQNQNPASTGNGSNQPKNNKRMIRKRML